MNEMKYCPMCGKNLTIKSIEGIERSACPDETCAYIFWDNPTPVVAAIIEREGKIILARNKEWPEKVFGTITGFLEKNEDPSIGVVREVKEELGLKSREISFIGNYIFTQKNQLIIAYHIIAEGEITIGEELAEVKEIPIEKVKPWPFGTGLALKDWLDKRSS